MTLATLVLQVCAGRIVKAGIQIPEPSVLVQTTLMVKAAVVLSGHATVAVHGQVAVR